MQKSIIIAIVAVVAIAACGCGLYFIMNDDTNTPVDYGDVKVIEGEYKESTTNLAIYGNANHDNYLNEDDLKYLESVLSSKTAWNKGTNPFVDVNADGKITTADVDLLKKLLNGETCTAYYMTFNLEPDDFHFPLSGQISAGLESHLQVGQIVGFYDDITYMLQPDSIINTLNKDLYPGARENIKSIGNYPYTYENVVASGVSAVLGDPYTYTDAFLKRIDESTNIDCIQLPVNREINGMNWSTLTITIGVMMNKAENTLEYIDYIESVEKDIKKAVESTGFEEKDYLIVYNPKPGSNSFGLDIHGTGSITMGDVATTEILPLNCNMTEDDEDGYVSNISIEKIIASDPDILIIETWGLGMDTDWTSYEAFAKEMADCFKHTRAYREGNVFVVAYENYGTLPGVSGLLYMASQIWPDQFDESKGLEVSQNYYDMFTPLDKKVTDVVGLLPYHVKTN